MLDFVLSAYNLAADECSVQPFGSGLINRTWKVTNGKKEYILQRINRDIFRQPERIAQNIQAVGLYLKTHFPGYLFIEPIASSENTPLVISGDQQYFRLLPFVPASHSYDVVSSPSLAFEAAKQFGQFNRLLSGLPAEGLHVILPDFHNLSLRYRQFETAVKTAGAERLEKAKESIAAIIDNNHIAAGFGQMKQRPQFKTRVMHHDTKISNVLFDKEGTGLCVIDLDTVMPGYFISDFGDMLRTYLSPVSEEEKDFSRITVRDEYFDAVVAGYLSEMKEELQPAELQYLVYAGKCMIYMQAIRFLADYLGNDAYYGALYEDHNLVRANNQITLLQRLTEKEEVLTRLIKAHLPLRLNQNNIT